MKKIAVLFAVVIVLGMMFSSTCKKDPYESPSPVDTSNGSGIVKGPPTTGTFKVFVAYQQVTNSKLVGADVYVFTSQALRDTAIKHSNTGNAGWHQQTVQQGDGNYATFTLPVAPAAQGGTTYWIWASDNYNGNNVLINGTDSMVMPNPCYTCGYSATVACQ